METTMIEIEKRDVYIMCPHCKYAESMGVDEPRKKFESLQNWLDEDSNGDERSLHKCTECDNYFVVVWDYHNAIREAIANLDKIDLINLHNDYCDDIRSGDHIYNNEEDFFSEHFNTTIEAIRAVAYGQYSYSETYVKFDGYANLETTSDLDNWIDFDELTGYVIENEIEV